MTFISVRMSELGVGVWEVILGLVNSNPSYISVH